jgi:DNA mismatch repair protein MutS
MNPPLDTAPPESDPGHVTPVMAQYIEIKAANPDCLLFYRMGDFYELFFDDAVEASRALGITLTKRGKHMGRDIPMAGVPVSTADDYLQKLIRFGFRIAVCEQTEDPAEARKRGSKSVVRREVERLVTPGTITEERLLVPSEASYLAAIGRTREGGSDAPPSLALAWIDLSTGEFRLAETTIETLPHDLARIGPREIILPDQLYDDREVRDALRHSSAAVTPLARDAGDGVTAERRIANFFSVQSSDVFGRFSRAESAAAALALSYVERTQLKARPTLSPPVRETRGALLEIDVAARANLELVKTLGGERAGSLLDAIDRTVTSAGGRELARRLAAPLTDPLEINLRLDAVSAFADDDGLRDAVRSSLRAAPDVARALSRLALERGGPRDLAAIRDGARAAGQLSHQLAEASGFTRPELFTRIGHGLTAPGVALADELALALADELPAFRRDGDFVRAGYDGELDAQRQLRDESRNVILALQATYQTDTGVKSLKVRHNNVLGYFVEVTQLHAEAFFKPPLSGTFIHRQTLAGQVRFTTPELSGLEQKIAAAADRALSIESAIYDRLAASVRADDQRLHRAATALAELDVHAGLADLAVSEGFVRPRIDGSLAFDIRGGRHPVVERALQRSGEGSFVSNDCNLSPPDAETSGRIFLVTGPNMAGKSTFLRQNALIAILAQAGAFVPAASAHIGVVDRLYSRVGAADDLARGRSTFMVEMVETATILNQATERSLVILDEIGRGTATFDGLSIAWASVEHLHDVNKSRALFATHFHELVELTRTLARLTPATMKVKEWQGDVVFLHEVGPGAADRSYGIQVAKLAGLPHAVVTRARTILERLEAGDRAADVKSLVDDLPLFASIPRTPPPAQPSRTEHAALVALLAQIDPDALTPRAALDALYQLKAALPRDVRSDEGKR